MIPSRRLLLLFALTGIPLVLPSVIGLFWPDATEIASTLHLVGIVLNFAILFASCADLIASPRLGRIELHRESAEVMSVGARNAVKIWMTNRNARPLTVEFHDEPPLPCTTDGLPFEIALNPHRPTYRVYHVIPHHRGQNEFGDVYLRVRSRWGLWVLCDQRPMRSAVRIYPDIQAVHGMELLARKNRIAETGVKLSRLRGRGNEFERLRDYVREDEYRHIDWKATARHQRVISREYVVERNQNVLFLLDCGRSMCNAVDGISHLDRGLNAAIALSYVALRQGDNVGFLACSNKVERWVRPMRGAGAIQTLIRSTYDLQSTFDASDYGLMVQELRRRFRKRSLVILLTHALDELHLQSISQHVRQLRSPHLVLGAFLRNVPLLNRLNDVPRTDVEAFQIAAAAEIVSQQTHQIAELQRSGLLVLETPPDQLSAHLINQYLDIKARHLL
jgi:uncharacterized protein (DUF58 family)